MKKIRLILDTADTSIGYIIDVESGQYSSGTFSKDDSNTIESIDESGDITDANLLAKRLYLIIHAAIKDVRPQSAEKK